MMEFRQSNKSLVNQRKRYLLSYLWPRSPVSEQYRTIRTSIQFAGMKNDTRVIMVTSPNPGEGKTTVATNLAIVFAQQENQVLLIDADLRKPSLHYIFQTANLRGLSNLLYHGNNLCEDVQSVGIEGLDLLTSGPIPPNPAELLNMKRMHWILQEARKSYDYIIIDTPPVQAVADPLILAQKCDGVVLVVSSGKTSMSDCIKAKELLAKNGATLLGTIINKSPKKVKKGGYYYPNYEKGILL